MINTHAYHLGRLGQRQVHLYLVPGPGLFAPLMAYVVNSTARPASSAMALASSTPGTWARTRRNGTSPAADVVAEHREAQRIGSDAGTRGGPLPSGR